MVATSFVVAMHTDTRLQLIHDWLTDDVALDAFTLEPASADASFRRYFRATTARRSLIVMDAPPDKEDVGPFLQVRALLADCDVHVPQVYATDAARGLLLLEDLGDRPLLAAVEAGANPEPLYADALKALVSIQVRGLRAMHELPAYDEAVLRREMALMP
jgi:aminoglycoside/choline kinase family phosphotransferase